MGFFLNTSLLVPLIIDGHPLIIIYLILWDTPSPQVFSLRGRCPIEAPSEDFGLTLPKTIYRFFILKWSWLTNFFVYWLITIIFLGLIFLYSLGNISGSYRGHYYCGWSILGLRKFWSSSWRLALLITTTFSVLTLQQLDSSNLVSQADNWFLNEHLLVISLCCLV